MQILFDEKKQIISSFVEKNEKLEKDLNELVIVLIIIEKQRIVQKFEEWFVLFLS